MKLIKLGRAYLNMDLATDIWVDHEQVSVFFAVPAMYSKVPFQGESTAVTTREIRFAGAEAAALIQWLEKRAKDISPDVDADEVADEDGAAATDEVGVPEFEAVDDGPGA